MFLHGRRGRVEIDLEAQMMRRSPEWGQRNGVQLYGDGWFPLDGDNGLLSEAFAQFKAERERSALTGRESRAGLEKGRISRWAIRLNGLMPYSAS
jgi:hypothetical protein